MCIGMKKSQKNTLRKYIVLKKWRLLNFIFVFFTEIFTEIPIFWVLLKLKHHYNLSKDHLLTVTKIVSVKKIITETKTSLK